MTLKGGLQSIYHILGLQEDVVYGSPGNCLLRSFQEAGALYRTQNSKALVKRAPTKRTPNFKKQSSTKGHEGLSL